MPMTLFKAAADQFKRLNARQQLWLGAAAAGALLLILVRLAYVPVLGVLGKQAAHNRTLRIKTADAQMLAQQTAQQDALLAQAGERYQALHRWTSSAESMPQIMELLSQQAKAHQVGVAAVQASGEPGAPSTAFGAQITLSEVPLQLTLTGRYWDIGELLGDLAEAPFLSVVRSLTIIRPTPDRVEVQATLVLGVYLTEERNKS